MSAEENKVVVRRLIEVQLGGALSVHKKDGGRRAGEWWARTQVCACTSGAKGT